MTDGGDNYGSIDYGSGLGGYVTPIYRPGVKTECVTTITYEKTHPDAKVPTRATPGSRGYDLFATEDGCVRPMDSMVIDLGIKFNIPDGCYFLIMSKSGLAAKNKTFVLNSPGLIDSDYRGNLMAILFNAHKMEEFCFKKGQKLCQLVVMPDWSQVEFVEGIVGEDTERGAGGLGSTGTH